MQHETATVKIVRKKYTTKDGIEKESISYNAKLKSDSSFNDGDIVAVALLDDFDELDNISAAGIHDLKKSIADKDDIIAANNESIAKYKAEIDIESDKIASLSQKIKPLEKNVAELKSDISEKDKLIAELTAKNEILHEKLDELTDLLSGKDKKIDYLDAEIVNCKVKLAKYDAIDVDKLKENHDKLNERLENKSNVISLLHNQMMELIQLIAYKDKKIDKLENKGVLDILFNKDVTAEIEPPTLYLIDESGSLIKDDDNIVDVDIKSDSIDAADDHEKNSSGDDDMILI